MKTRCYGASRLVLCILPALALAGASLFWYRGLTPGAVAGGGDVRREESCGPVCLWICAQRLGIQSSQIDLKQHFEDGTYNGTTLYDLLMVSQRLGIHSEIATITWEELRQHKGVVVAYLEERHFVAIDPREKLSTGEGKGQNIVRVYDPDRFARWMAKDELVSKWEGRCLLMHERRSDYGDPELRVSSCYEDVGLVRTSTHSESQFEIINGGASPLTIRIIGTTCGCTSAKLSQAELLPGELCNLDVGVNLEDKQGRFAESVTVAVDGGAARRIEFIVSGTVLRPVRLSTQRGYLGRISPGSEGRCLIAIYDRGDGQLELGPLRCELVEPIEGASAQPRLRVHEVDVTDLSFEERQSLSLSRHDRVVGVWASVPSNCSPGKFEGRIQIETMLSDMDSPLNVACEGVVLPDLVAEPEAIRLSSDAQGGSLLGRVRLRSVSGTPITGLDVQVNPANSVEVEIDEDRADQMVLTVSTKDIPVGVNGTIVCSSADGRCIEIPYVVLSTSSSGSESAEVDGR